MVVILIKMIDSFPGLIHLEMFLIWVCQESSLGILVRVHDHLANEMVFLSLVYNHICLTNWPSGLPTMDARFRSCTCTLDFSKWLGAHLTSWGQFSKCFKFRSSGFHYEIIWKPLNYWSISDIKSVLSDSIPCSLFIFLILEIYFIFKETSSPRMSLLLLT